MPSIRNGLAERSPDDAQKKKPDTKKSNSESYFLWLSRFFHTDYEMLIARGVALSQLLYLMHCKLGWPYL